MNNDLKIIKKKYGEAMMHLCREVFSTILDNSPGILSEIIQDTFYPTHYLYDDLVENEVIGTFKNYIYEIYDKLTNSKEKVKTYVDNPVTLMKQAGYTLYECTCEEDIQKFRKYYAQGEELCTFRGGRLNRCYVYFAVHNDADKLKRDNFSHPERQDEYGTSVISIQFTRDDSHTISIKNRYNHTVLNPDATFSNDLDNIISGLTQSFADYYGMTQLHNCKKFEVPGYMMADDGKFYKYNYEINNVYYCPDNIVINNFQVKKFPKEKYLVMECYILDLVNKQFVNHSHNDSFINTIGTIKNISILNNHDEKIITITPSIGEDIIIKLDKFSRIISYHNKNVTKIYSDFLSNNRVLENISLENVREIGNKFLYLNQNLKEISLPNAKVIGHMFMIHNQLITTVDFPNVTQVGEYFMVFSNATDVLLPKLMKISANFMSSNNSLQHLDLPSVTWIGPRFLEYNLVLEHISLPNARTIGANCLFNNRNLQMLSLPNVETVNDAFCYSNVILREIYAPKLHTIGRYFLCNNECLTEIELPSALNIGESFLKQNYRLTSARFPKLTRIYEKYFLTSPSLQEFYAPRLVSKLKNGRLRELAKKSKTERLSRIFTRNKTK